MDRVWTKNHRCVWLVCAGMALALALVAACGDRSVAPPKSVATLPSQAPQGEWKAVIVDGALESKSVGEWRGFAQGESVSGVRELRAHGAGAELHFSAGDAELARVWLRGGAHLRLGQADDGAIVVELLRGQVRLRSFSRARARWFERGQLAELDSADVLLSAEPRSPAVLTVVSAAPERVRWTGQLGTAPASSGFGTLQRAGAGGDSPLQLQSVKLDAVQSGHQALVEIEHRFQNDEDQTIEGVFRFPLPAGAALVGLAMDIGGKLMEGELVEREKARQTYESIVDSMRDPALLEWEPGNVFKLRVFPIEPKQLKRVVVRYLTPLDRTDAGLGVLRIAVGSPPLQGTPPKLRATFNGEVVYGDDGFPSAPNLDFVGKTLGEVYATTADDAVYTSVLFTAPMAPQTKRGSGSSRDVLVLLDTSRSSLESRPLQTDALAALLESLGPDDRVKVAISDLAVTELTPAWGAARVTADTVLRAFAQSDADGASDLGAALIYAQEQRSQRGDAGVRGDRAAAFEVVYIGDATATWGETRPEKLTELATDVGAPIHLLALGSGAAHDLLRHISSTTGGRVASPREPADVRAWATALGAIAGAPRYTKLKLAVPDGVVAYPSGEQTLLPGETLPLVIRTQKDKPVPSSLAIAAHFEGRQRRLSVTLVGAQDAPWVGQRWAREHLAMLENSGAPREQIVAASLDYGVMSRDTAFLVLESEEAYKLHDIERKQRDTLQLPRVSGGDLESVNGRSASLSPDRLQPGDPEVLIPAPADARSVRVIFPFGETKDAEYEAELGVWSVRFLVEQSTPDGVYPVTVRVEHADGQVQLLELSYVVDTAAPTLDLAIAKRGAKVYLEVRQTTSELEAQLAERDSVADANTLVRRFGKDAKRAELRLPDGSVLPMIAIKLAEFRVQLPERAWSHLDALAPLELRVLVWDKAGNLREMDVEVSADLSELRIVGNRATAGEGLL